MVNAEIEVQVRREMGLEASKEYSSFGCLFCLQHSSHTMLQNEFFLLGLIRASK